MPCHAMLWILQGVPLLRSAMPSLAGSWEPPRGAACRLPDRYSRLCASCGRGSAAGAGS